MSALAVAVALTVLVGAVCARWSRSGWMPIRSAHAVLDFRSLTLDGIPIEEVFDHATAVRHPYPLSEPDDLPIFLDPLVFRFEEPRPDPFRTWQFQWLVGRHIASDSKPFRHINPN